MCAHGLFTIPAFLIETFRYHKLLSVVCYLIACKQVIHFHSTERALCHLDKLLIGVHELIRLFVASRVVSDGRVKKIDLKTVANVILEWDDLLKRKIAFDVILYVQNYTCALQIWKVVWNIVCIILEPFLLD